MACGQTTDHISKHFEVRQTYFATRRIFNSLLDVPKSGQVAVLLHLVLHRKAIKG